MNTPERNSLLFKLVELRAVAIRAQQLAQDDENAYDVILALDPVVEGAHEALKLLGIGFMEYPKRSEYLPSKKPCPTCGGDKRGVWRSVGCTTIGSYRTCPDCGGRGTL